MKTINLKNIIVKEIIITPNEHIVVTYAFLDENNVAVYMKQGVIKVADFPHADKLETFITKLLVSLKDTEGVL